MQKRIAMATSVLMLMATVSTSPAWAGWGCAARAANGDILRVWGASSRHSAATAVLDNCADDGDRCRIIACRRNVDSQEEAHSYWPGGRVIKCYSGNCRLGHID